MKKPVFRIRKFLDLQDPNPLVRGTDLDPDQDVLIIKQTNVRKPLICTVLWLLYDFLYVNNEVNVPSKINKQKNFEKK